MKELLEKIFEMIANFFSQGEVKPELPLIKITYTPQLGDTSTNTGLLQLRLNELANAGLKTDNKFGPKTLEAVKAFQKSIGLPGSGMIGDKTLEALRLKVESYSNHSTGPVNKRIIEIATKEIGQKEIAGEQHNPRILEYHSTTGKFSDDETAWCSSFCKWVCLEAGIDPAKLSGVTAAARSWLRALVDTLNPKEGDIVIFWRGSRDGWQGHVGFYVGETATHIRVLGGNQSNSVNISLYPKSQVLGYRTYA